MEKSATSTSHRMLFFNTLAFTVCFAAWMLNGVLVVFLVEQKIFYWNTIEIGWLLAIPVLSGSLFRFPVGILSDNFGGKWIFGILMFFCSVPMFLLSYANSFTSFALLSFCYGLAGTSFAVGIANTSVWYPKKFQGTVLGVFGMGNAGVAITTFFAPLALNYFSQNSLDGWRIIPKLYSAVLFTMAIAFLIFTENKKSSAKFNTISQIISPLKNSRVWRFSLYYFLVFGCFVALSQWLVHYFVNVYSVSIVTAGIFASLFTFPSGIIRALGGWLSDKFGARKIMYWVLCSSTLFAILLLIPNLFICVAFIMLIGISWGIGKAAVYKYIPDYFPDEVGTVGGLVGVIGGLGGFFCPIIFVYLLEFTGLWSSCWMFMFLLSVICLLWMIGVINSVRPTK